MSVLSYAGKFADETLLKEICDFCWPEISEDDMIGVAWSYYHFSIQFRENLEIACDMFPHDQRLTKLRREEIGTDNLSPYPYIASDGEALDHDEFMRRVLLLVPISEKAERLFRLHGNVYLQEIRSIEPKGRALSIGSYESGGLERLFRSILNAPAYDNKLLMGFRFFMAEHIEFDSDPVNGHGALSRHMIGDESITLLWQMFKRLLLACTPNLQRKKWTI